MMRRFVLVSHFSSAPLSSPSLYPQFPPVPKNGSQVWKGKAGCHSHQRGGPHESPAEKEGRALRPINRGSIPNCLLGGRIEETGRKHSLQETPNHLAGLKGGGNGARAAGPGGKRADDQKANARKVRLLIVIMKTNKDSLIFLLFQGFFFLSFFLLFFFFSSIVKHYKKIKNINGRNLRPPMGTTGRSPGR